MPSQKPFVIAYISRRVADALQHDAKLLSSFGVQPGNVAVEQMWRAVRARRPKLAQLPDELRLVRRRWLVDEELHRAIHATAAKLKISVSEFAARAVQPARNAGSGSFEAVDIGQQFYLPRWVFEILLDERQNGEREIWPWRLAGVGNDAKRAYRDWVTKHHPDKGGDHEYFVRGKDDWERMQT